MFGRWLDSAKQVSAPEGAEELARVVRAELAHADDETVRVVTAIAGLLGGVAYADREFSQAELSLVRAELSRIHGMTDSAVAAICEVMSRHIIEVSTVQSPRYCRDLKALTDRELRLEVLQVLVDVAAADGEISNDEVNLLRHTTSALGLSQDDYNDAQARHRDKLKSLK